MGEIQFVQNCHTSASIIEFEAQREHARGGGRGAGENAGEGWRWSFWTVGTEH